MHLVHEIMILTMMIQRWMLTLLLARRKDEAFAKRYIQHPFVATTMNHAKTKGNLWELVDQVQEQYEFNHIANALGQMHPQPTIQQGFQRKRLKRLQAALGNLTTSKPKKAREKSQECENLESASIKYNLHQHNDIIRKAKVSIFCVAMEKSNSIYPS